MVGSVSREQGGSTRTLLRLCKCSYDKLSTPNPTCDYIALMDVNEAKRRKCVDINERKTTSSQCRGTTSDLHFWRNTYLCKMTFTDHSR
jgi:hypothetical protein